MELIVTWLSLQCRSNYTYFNETQSCLYSNYIFTKQSSDYEIQFLIILFIHLILFI